jgi:hypothetical protein
VKRLIFSSPFDVVGCEKALRCAGIWQRVTGIGMVPGLNPGRLSAPSEARYRAAARIVPLLLIPDP